MRRAKIMARAVAAPEISGATPTSACIYGRAVGSRCRVSRQYFQKLELELELELDGNVPLSTTLPELSPLSSARS
jgi:hypothetical protein